MAESAKERQDRILQMQGKPGGETKVKPLADYDPTKPKPVVTPVPKPSPAETEDADEPTRDKYDPGLGGTAAYNAALKKYRADKTAKKAGQMKAMKEPSQ